MIGFRRRSLFIRLVATPALTIILTVIITVLLLDAKRRKEAVKSTTDVLINLMRNGCDATERIVHDWADEPPMAKPRADTTVKTPDPSMKPAAPTVDTQITLTNPAPTGRETTAIVVTAPNDRSGVQSDLPFDFMEVLRAEVNGFDSPAFNSRFQRLCREVNPVLRRQLAHELVLDLPRTHYPFSGKLVSKFDLSKSLTNGGSQ